MQLFYDVSRNVVKPEIMDDLSGFEKSINVSIAKTKWLLQAERDQEIRSSSGAHHENHLKKQDARLEAFRLLEGEILGNELIEIMARPFLR